MFDIDWECEIAVVRRLSWHKKYLMSLVMLRACRHDRQRVDRIISYHPVLF